GGAGYRLEWRTPQRSARLHMRRSLSLLCVLITCGLLIDARPLDAQQPAPQNEYDIKAGWFYFLGGLIQWPKQPFKGADKDFVIGVLGNNPFGAYIRPDGKGASIHSTRITTDTIQRKPIKVIQYSSVAEFQNSYSPCHILFISRSSAPGVLGETAQSRVEAALQKTTGQPVVLVGEAENEAESLVYAKSGIIICYWNDLQEKRVKMVVNDTHAKRGQLKVLSPLLRLRIVTVL
ncbi:YfiR family protein, partial [Stieleria sp.]|uniref:YfiR family protein n=1 Tax=Stieleria sp. TaxID=2795976 RepID=UPI00356A8FC9